MEMGKEIKRLRVERGLTQEALAAALNVTAQTVSKWECGNSLPDVQMIPEIAVYFGVTIDRLFAMTEEQQLDRIENHIYSKGLIDEAEERGIEGQLRTAAEKPELEGKAKLILTELYNHQAEQYRLMAVESGKEAVELTRGDRNALGELANAWGSYIPDWCVRNHHALIAWFSDFCTRNPSNRAAVMWLLDNLIDDRRLAEAKEWLEKLERIDSSFRVPMYRYLIALAEGDSAEMERQLSALEEMADSEWCCATTLGDMYTQKQEYEKAIVWYRRGQEIQSSPKYTDSALGIAHICEITGDKNGAIEAYNEALRILRDEWGIVKGEELDTIERAVARLK